MKIQILARKLRRRWYRLFRAIRGWLVMRNYWKNRLQKFEKKARFIDRMRYFGSYRCYREYMDYRRYHR